VSQTNELRVVVYCDSKYDAMLANRVGLEFVVGQDMLENLVDYSLMTGSDQLSENRRSFYGRSLWLSSRSHYDVKEHWHLYCEAVVRGANVVGVILPVYTCNINWSIPDRDLKEKFDPESVMRGAAIFWEAEKARRRECPLRPLF
jgi:hypothetical protein